MNDRVAIYAGTRNLYPQMYTALKSLLINNSMDRVFLLIEDDEFPYPLPKHVFPVNVSEQEIFKKDSPNFKNKWSYMTLMRCVLSTIFEKEKRVLWLDCDTIVDDDITDLFEMNINGYYYAGVMEPGKSLGVFRYINAGVLLCNCELLRETGKEFEMTYFLNAVKLEYLDQDIINILCQGRIRLIDSTYNSNNYVMPCFQPKIIHYAAIKDYTNEWAYKKYEKMDMPMEDKDEQHN